MCIYWLTSLESKGAAAPRIPCAYMCQTWNLAEGTQLSPPHCKLCLPTLSTFCTATMNIHLQQEMEKLFNMNSMERVLGLGMQRRVSLDFISVLGRYPGQKYGCTHKWNRESNSGSSSLRKLVWPVPLAQVWSHYKIGKLNMWTLFCNVCIHFLNSQIWKEIMLDLNWGEHSSVTTFSTDFSFQNLVFWNLFEISATENHFKINISHILNPNITK